jgi:predicted adenine nucleotide alpha hydrolase (AANH) superfamily ATPase
MKEILSLKEEIDKLVQRNNAVYLYKSDVSFERKKELRFKELKNILAKFNRKYLLNNYLNNDFINSM